MPILIWALWRPGATSPDALMASATSASRVDDAMALCCVRYGDERWRSDDSVQQSLGRARCSTPLSDVTAASSARFHCYPITAFRLGAAADCSSARAFVVARLEYSAILAAGFCLASVLQAASSSFWPSKETARLHLAHDWSSRCTRELVCIRAGSCSRPGLHG